MAIKRRKRFAAHVESSSMSDIMFFLLLFFLIISTLANPNVIKVPLPDAKPSQETASNHMAVTIDSDRRYYIDQEEVPFDQLEKRIVAEAKKRGDETVVIRPAYDVQVQELIDVLQMGLRNQLKFVIATKPGQ